jgi:hypothetical protein
VTRYLLDVASYQGTLSAADVIRAGFSIVNLKISHGLTQRSVHPDITGWVSRCKAAGLGISTFHFLTGDTSGAAQATYAYGRLQALGLLQGTAHVVDVETNPAGPNATEAIFREYVAAMQALLERPIMNYTGDHFWEPRGWTGGDLTPYLHAAPNDGYLGAYPGDSSPHWVAGYGGWPELAAMQYAVQPLSFPDGSTATIKVSKSAIRSDAVWSALTGGGGMASWVLVPCLIALRGAFNALNPNRDKASDGSVGDSAHADSVSDHNPDESGNTGGVEDSDSINEVHAIDVDITGPWPRGLTMEKIVQNILAECRAGREKRLRYIIFNRRIWSASSGWEQRSYTGSNPHDKHAHFSAVYGSGASHPEQSTATWNLEGEIDMAGLTGEDVDLMLGRDKIPNPRQRHDAATNPTTTWGFAVSDTWGQVYNLIDAVEALPEAIVAALTKATPLLGPDGKPDGTSTFPIGRVLDQGVPNPFNGGKRSPYWKVSSDTSSAVAALAGALTQARAENAAQEAATAKLVQTLIDLVKAGNGNLDTATIMTKLDEVQADIVEAANVAGDAAADAVMDSMRRAAMAEAAVLADPVDSLEKAVAANPPKE